MSERDTKLSFNALLGSSIQGLSKTTISALKKASGVASSGIALPKMFTPVLRLVLSDTKTNREELSKTLDTLFEALYVHPLTNYSRDITDYLRKSSFIPNEESTERLIRYLVSQSISRSPVEIPELVVEEFWLFFQELIESPELQGIFELNLEISRAVLRVYEPLLVEVINTIKTLRALNRDGFNEIVRKLQVLRGDIQILKRQVQAIRYIKPFLETDPKDFKTQAAIVSQMVSEFGPLFIKMAQVAAASADFLPEEIARELEVFQQDVEPMSAEQVRQAFIEDFGQAPENLYYDFDANKPLKSGSIGSVFVAKKAIETDGKAVLVPIVVKVARHNLEREFAMGSLAIELMLISSQYWAPHSKLKPFLKAMALQIKEFTRGFEQELDFSHEAITQRRFYERSLASPVWSVPKVYGGSGRVIEMEYLDQAVTISQALDVFAKIPNIRRSIAHNFLYTVLENLIVHQEFHGDLHAGNVLVDEHAHLYLIDWGNSVSMQGKWSYVFDYITSALCGDVDSLANTLVEMSTDPERHRLRMDEIRASLSETLAKRELEKIEPWQLWRFYKEGATGLRVRVSTAMQLLSNTYQLGMTIHSDYLHLSRSVAAMIATYANLYSNEKRWRTALEFGEGIVKAPFTYGITNISRDVYALVSNRVRSNTLRVPSLKFEFVPLLPDYRD